MSDLVHEWVDDGRGRSLWIDSARRPTARPVCESFPFTKEG